MSEGKFPRPGLTAVANTDQRIVSMIEFQGRIFVAAEHGVYELVTAPNGNTRLRPIEFTKAPQ